MVVVAVVVVGVGVAGGREGGGYIRGINQNLYIYWLNFKWFPTPGLISLYRAGWYNIRICLRS